MFTLLLLFFIHNSIIDQNIIDFEFLLLFSFSIFASLLLVSSFDLITLYLSIELQSLCFYILAASKRKSRSSSEAGLKYFILGACSSSLLLFGMSLIYGFTGSTNFGDIAKILISLGNAELFIFNSLILGFLFLLFGFFFKLTIVPFHV
jgi:NADH:ubiquinone oxidoreductase subunit 2 (subunit N)